MKNQLRFVHGKILLLFVPWGNLVPLLRLLARVVQKNNNVTHCMEKSPSSG